MSEPRKKAEQILQLEPANELVFCGPFKDVVSTTLTLRNPTEKAVAFKVKTTAPRHYCVKPNNGLVPPNDFVKVDVMLQPFEYKTGENIRHKFMVQTMIVSGDSSDVESLWKTSDQSLMMDSKLKCVFDVPTEAQATEEEAQSTPKPREPATVAQSTLQTTTTFGTPAANASAPTLPASDVSESVRNPSTNVQPSQEPPLDATTPNNQPQTSPVNQKQIDEQLEAIKTENLKLKKELADLKEEGPRQRVSKEQPTTAATTMSTMNMSQELNASQISPILAAILALIIGYLIGKFIL
ncbi:vesicle-associated membrane protein-associated protein B-like [Rhopilema esculentum]|uniref:vesicle-associated membrane protein-associated protein B-like n=1 Tax=Rhopilema esculentum TaxID=499914 RepID=UPI0031DA02F4|eukprot:gene1343-15743_t